MLQTYKKKGHFYERQALVHSLEVESNFKSENLTPFSSQIFLISSSFNGFTSQCYSVKVFK